MVPTATRPKNLLFCPDCGHESPVGGDWVVRPSETRDVYACPECGAAVTARCRSDGPERSDPTTAAGSGATGSSTTDGLAGLLGAWRRRLAPSRSFGWRP